MAIIKGDFTMSLASKSMDQAYEDYFNSLAEGEEAMSFAEFVESLS